MDILLRTIAIFVEVAILMSIIYVMLAGVFLTAFDLGIAPKYRRVVTMALVLVDCVAVVFFIVHLTLLYPAV